MHQYSFPGMPKLDMQREYAKDRRDFERRGVTPSFMDRAFKTPPEDMWFPTTEELRKANVVTTDWPR